MKSFLLVYGEPRLCNFRRRESIRSVVRSKPTYDSLPCTQRRGRVARSLAPSLRNPHPHSEMRPRSFRHARIDARPFSFGQGLELLGVTRTCET